MWWSIVNERTTENILSPNGIAVASPTCTVTFASGRRWRRERAKLGSKFSSRHVICPQYWRSQSVVRPGPGPSSSTAPPQSNPFKDQGRISVPSLSLQWFDWQYHRCSRFIGPLIMPRREPASLFIIGDGGASRPHRRAGLLLHQPALNLPCPHGQRRTQQSGSVRSSEIHRMPQFHPPPPERNDFDKSCQTHQRKSRGRDKVSEDLQ